MYGVTLCRELLCKLELVVVEQVAIRNDDERHLDSESLEYRARSYSRISI
jgi:hypothetical protein